MKGNTLAIVLLVVGLVVGAGAGYFIAPRGDDPGDGGDGTPITIVKAPLEGVKIRLGYITSDTVALETAVPLVKDILTVDYNTYLNKLGMDTTLEFLVDNADGQAAIHLEKVQGYKAMNVNVFIGGGWSSQAQAALSYVNDNNMLMWSSSSTSPILAIPNDNLFRMCPDDTIQAPAISQMLVSHGIKAMILIQRADAWADGIYNFLEPEYTGAGGVILERIRYAGEVIEFSSYLQTAEDIAKQAVAQYGAEHVGVEIISFSEFVVMMTQAQDYPTLYNLVWFGSDGTTLSQLACDDAPHQVAHLKVHSTYAAPAESEKFNDLYARYFALVSQPFGYYSACAYDIGWVLVESILNAQSLDASDLVPLQHTTAYNNFGASGWNRLNEAGDRYGSNYQIWSYRWDGEVVVPYVSGLYDGISGHVTWYTQEMGYIPPSW